MKLLSRALFAAYLIVLLWLVLFKFSYDPIGVLRDYQTRSLNLIPFAYANKSEVISNIFAFIPFGVMLGIDFKQLPFRNKIAVIFFFSLAVETLQYVLAIGATDITDIIANTLGGFVGLTGYFAISMYTNQKYLDRCLLVTGMLILAAVLYLRIFVVIIRY